MFFIVKIRVFKFHPKYFIKNAVVFILIMNLFDFFGVKIEMIQVINISLIAIAL